MKRHFFAIFTIFSFLAMLFSAEEVFRGASSGILLWFHTVLPTLLPFLIIVNVIQKTSLLHFISHFTGPVFCPLFKISRNGCFAVLTGFLCGFPMGAKVTADLVRSRKITREEGGYLLSFCNQTSPGFMTGFVVYQTLQSPALIWQSMLIFFMTPILMSFVFRKIYLKRGKGMSVPECFRSSDMVTFELLDTAVMDGIEAITKIGGYIMIFSIFMEVLSDLPFFAFLPGKMVLSSLEITNGVAMLGTLPLHFREKYACIMGLCSFGGFCAAAQTGGMLHGSGLKIVPYIIEKLAAAAATSLVSYLFLFIIG